MDAKNILLITAESHFATRQNSFSTIPKISFKFANLVKLTVRMQGKKMIES